MLLPGGPCLHGSLLCRELCARLGRETHREEFKIYIDTTGKKEAFLYFAKWGAGSGLQGVKFRWDVAVVPSAPLCGELCLMVGLAAWEVVPKPLSNMRPMHASTSLPVLGYFNIPGYKMPDLIHLCFWSSIPGQQEKSCLCYQWPETEHERASPEEKKSGVLPQKSQETAFPIQCVHLSCNLFRERHSQLLPGRWVSSCYGAAMLWLHYFSRWKGFYAVFLNNRLPCHKLLSSSKLAFEKPNTLPIVFVGKTKRSGIFLWPLEENPPWVAEVLLEWHLESFLASLAPQQFGSHASDQALCSIRLILSNIMKGGKISLSQQGWAGSSQVHFRRCVPVSWWS